MSVIMAFVMLVSSVAQAAPAGSRVVIKAGTMVPLELVTAISSKSVAPGAPIDFRLINDIVVDRKIAIRAGSIARGQVQRVKKNGLFGKAGELEVIVRSINAVDGTNIMLTGGQLSEEGSNKLVLSVALTVLVCLLCFLIRGGNAEIPAGTQCTATIPSDVEIDV
ncbi:MAG: hypothetical protein LBR97_03545 [Dysgonamonadaceae bacterium]|nr:hypothetical protein [Dysgonamonadaceae bacterium]